MGKTRSVRAAARRCRRNTQNPCRRTRPRIHRTLDQRPPHRSAMESGFESRWNGLSVGRKVQESGGDLQFLREKSTESDATHKRPNGYKMSRYERGLPRDEASIRREYV